MVRVLLTGIPVIVLCMALQAAFVALCVNRYVALRDKPMRHGPAWRGVRQLSAVMVLSLIGEFVQMAIWATLYVMLGEFEDFATALYYSGVTFTTLGYGDFVMSERWRLLGALEAANGILMFGVSTALMTAAAMDVFKQSRGERQ